MVSIISPALLIVFCLGVTSQRKYTKNIPAGVDVKAVANFDCPEEFGYYPHPTDCTQYYVCVFGGALLESCTGGLMYSHELQTCDWPRNVGCDGLELSASPAAAAVSSSTSSRGRERERERERERDRERDREEPRTRYTPPPPPPQPAAVVTSRGQPRQLQTKQEFIKQQQQLYTEAEESLPPAEEVESDRQQRVYRGQPSTRQSERDGIRHSNAIPTYSGRGDKIGVISFGTQNQHYSDVTDLDEIVSNDLNIQRRSKRQAHRSMQQHQGLSTWHGGRRTKNAARVNPTLPFLGNIAQKPKKNDAFIPSVPLHQFGATQEVDEFKPFIPSYFKPNNYQSFSLNPQTYAKDVGTSQNQYFYTFPSEQARPSVERPFLISPGGLLMEAAPSQIVTEKSRPEKLPSSTSSRNHFKNLETKQSKPNVIHEINFSQEVSRSPERENQVSEVISSINEKNIPELSSNHREQEGQLTQAITKGYEPLSTNNQNSTSEDEDSKEVSDIKETNNNSTVTNEESSSSYDEEADHYDPPPEFFNTENKYENIYNPFADPNFDFDKFLDGFTTSTTTTTTTTTTTKPEIKVIHYYQPLPSSMLANKQISQIQKTSMTSLLSKLSDPKGKIIPNSNGEVIIMGLPSVSLNPTKNLVNTSIINYEVREPVQDVLDSPVPLVPFDQFLSSQLLNNVKGSIKNKDELTSSFANPNSKTVVSEYFESTSKPKFLSNASSSTSNPKQISTLKTTTATVKKATTVSNKPNFTIRNTAPSTTKKASTVTPTSKKQPSTLRSAGVTAKRPSIFQKKPVPVKNDYYYEYEDILPANANTKNDTIYTVKGNVTASKKPSDEYEYYYDYDYAIIPSNSSVFPSNKEKIQKLSTSTVPLPTIRTPQVDIKINHKDPKNRLNKNSDSQNAQSITHAYHSTTTRSTIGDSTASLKQNSDKTGVTTERNNRANKRGQNQFSKSDDSSVAPQPTSSTSAQAARTSVYNSSQYNNNQYEPYYALYDDDVELYRDEEYSQNNYNTNSARAQTSSTYRGTPAPAPAVHATSVREELPKRGKPVYLQNNNYNQDIYQQSTVADYHEDNRYDAQVEDQNSYRQSNRQPSRGDRNDINDVEEVTKKRTTSTSTTRKTTTTTSTTTTTPRTTPPPKSTLPPTSQTPHTSKEIQIQEQSILNTETIYSGISQKNTTSPLINQDTSEKKQNITSDFPVTYRPNNRFFLSLQHENNNSNKFPEPFNLNTNRPTFHYITKQPRTSSNKEHSERSEHYDLVPSNTSTVPFIGSRTRNDNRYNDRDQGLSSTPAPVDQYEEIDEKGNYDVPTNNRIKLSRISSRTRNLSKYDNTDFGESSTIPSATTPSVRSRTKNVYGSELSDKRISHPTPSHTTPKTNNIYHYDFIEEENNGTFSNRGPVVSNKKLGTKHFDDVEISSTTSPGTDSRLPVISSRSTIEATTSSVLNVNDVSKHPKARNFSDYQSTEKEDSEIPRNFLNTYSNSRTRNLYRYNNADNEENRTFPSTTSTESSVKKEEVSMDDPVDFSSVVPIRNSKTRNVYKYNAERGEMSSTIAPSITSTESIDKMNQNDPIDASKAVKIKNSRTRNIYRYIDVKAEVSSTTLPSTTSKDSIEKSKNIYQYDLKRGELNQNDPLNARSRDPIRNSRTRQIDKYNQEKAEVSSTVLPITTITQTFEKSKTKNVYHYDVESEEINHNDNMDTSSAFPIRNSRTRNIYKHSDAIAEVSSTILPITTTTESFDKLKNMYPYDIESEKIKQNNPIDDSSDVTLRHSRTRDFHKYNDANAEASSTILPFTTTTFSIKKTRTTASPRELHKDLKSMYEYEYDIEDDEVKYDNFDTVSRQTSRNDSRVKNISKNYNKDRQVTPTSYRNSRTKNILRQENVEEQLGRGTISTFPPSVSSVDSRKIISYIEPNTERQLQSSTSPSHSSVISFRNSNGKKFYHYDNTDEEVDDPSDYINTNFDSVLGPEEKNILKYDISDGEVSSSTSINKLDVSLLNRQKNVDKHENTEKDDLGRNDNSGKMTHKKTTSAKQMSEEYIVDREVGSSTTLSIVEKLHSSDTNSTIPVINSRSQGYTYNNKKEERIAIPRKSSANSSGHSRGKKLYKYVNLNGEVTSTVTPSKLSTTFTNRKVIAPTTYAPPKFVPRSNLPKSSAIHTVPLYSVRPSNKSDSISVTSHKVNVSTENNSGTALKAAHKHISPVNINHSLSSSIELTSNSAEKLPQNSSSDIWPEVQSVSSKDNKFNSKNENLLHIKTFVKTTSSTSTTTEITPTSVSPESVSKKKTESSKILFKSSENDPISDDYLINQENSLLKSERLNKNFESNSKDNATAEKNESSITAEVSTSHELHHEQENETKAIPDQSPTFKIKPKVSLPVLTSLPTNLTKTNSSHATSSPTRVSRVNSAIKSLIAIGGFRRTNSKCLENDKCSNESKRRASTRGRGTAHYASSGQIANNEVTVNTNRGTAPPRARPTLKPSTSIVSKAQEFVDIYRYPPRRPDPIYPQPQPDKTAAKCRKDVCLLPDCSCGGKEIPGDLPVEQVPQIVLLTFDDSVNDLNKGLYQDLFERGRTNPNGCPIAATFYVSHEWTDYSQVQNLYSDGHELASHTVSHSFGEQFSQKKWTKEIAGQREILAAYGGVHLEDVRGMRAPFLSVGGNKMFKMLYDSNFTYDSSMPIYENKPPSWPYTLDYKLFHDCMIPPCPTRSYPGVWEVPMVMWQDLNGGRCSMGDACSNPPDADGVFKMLTKNFQRHYTTNRAPFGLFYHAAWFTQPHHKEGFINFIDSILQMKDVWLITNWQAIQWVRDPTPVSKLNNFQPFQCDFSDRPKRCNNPKVCNLWHKSGVRYMRTCQPCPDIYPWTGNTGIRSSRIDNEIEE